MYCVDSLPQTWPELFSGIGVWTLINYSTTQSFLRLWHTSLLILTYIFILLNHSQRFCHINKYNYSDAQNGSIASDE